MKKYDWKWWLLGYIIGVIAILAIFIWWVNAI